MDNVVASQVVFLFFHSLGNKMNNKILLLVAGVTFSFSGFAQNYCTVGNEQWIAGCQAVVQIVGREAIAQGRVPQLRRQASSL